MNFKKLYKVLVEDTETLEDKEKRYLGWISRSILNKNNAQKAAYNMFIRIFGFDPDKYKGKYLYNFEHLLIHPYYDWLSNEEIKQIEKIANIEYLSRYLTGNNQISLNHLFQHIADKYDLSEDKILRIFSIIFTFVGTKIAKAGHKDWENLLFRKSLDKETEQDWGEIITNL